VGLPGAFVVPQKVATFLGGEPEPRYDLVLLDPPYDIDILPTLEAVIPWLAEEAVVMVERSTRDPELVWPAGLVAERSRRYGEATLWYGFRS
jgi:16S rRNA (guanine966-N2)-methyltransferase